MTKSFRLSVICKVCVVSALAFVLTFGPVAQAVWDDPSANPPNGNVAAPLNEVTEFKGDVTGKYNDLKITVAGCSNNDVLSWDNGDWKCVNGSNNNSQNLLQVLNKGADAGAFDGQVVIGGGLNADDISIDRRMTVIGDTGMAGLVVVGDEYGAAIGNSGNAGAFLAYQDAGVVGIGEDYGIRGIAPALLNFNGNIPVNSDTAAIHGESTQANVWSGYFKGGKGMYVENRVGIGTDSPNPNAQLHIYNPTGSAEINLEGAASDGNHWAIYDDGTYDSLNIWKSGTVPNNGGNILTIAPSGNVGIHTSLPFAPLHVVHNGATRVAMFTNINNPTNSNIVEIANVNTGVLININGDNPGLRNAIRVGSNQEVFSVSGAGKVKIADGTQAAGRVLVSDLSGLASWVDPAGIGGGGTSDVFWGGSLAGNINNLNTGNVGIGVANPVEKVDVLGSVNVDSGSSYKKGGVTILTSEGNTTLVGVQAGLSNAANFITAVGYQALKSNTTGQGNTALGYQALADNTSGLGNIAIGTSALSSNTTGAYNLSLGNSSLESNTTGGGNVAVGAGTLKSNITGGANVAVGANALQISTNNSNTALGNAALYNTTGGSSNIAVGSFAGANITTGSRNVVIGYQIDAPVAAGNNQLTIGNLIYGTGVDGAGTTVSSGNIGIGTSAPNSRLHVYKDTGNNSEIDIQSVAGAGNHWGLYSNRSDNSFRVWRGSDRLTILNNGSIGIGTNSPDINSKLDISGKIKIVDGTQGLNKVLTSDINGLASWTDPGAIIASGPWTKTGTNIHQTILTDNVGIGTATPAEKLDVVGSVNINFGSGYKQNGGTILATDAGYNISLGRFALNTGTSGANNVAAGTFALGSNTSGDNNIALGFTALGSNVSGDNNAALGWSSLAYSTGIGNTAIGNRSGYSVSTGGYNTILGNNAGANLTTGSSNIVIGQQAEVPSVTANNQLSIGNLIYGTGVDGTGTTVSSGNIGIGTGSPNSRLHVYKDTGNNSEIDIQSTSAVGSHWAMYHDRTSQDLRFWNNNISGEKNSLTLTDAGNVGIGNVNPAQKLDVTGSARVDGSVQVVATAAPANGITLYPNNSSVPRITMANSFGDWNMDNTTAGAFRLFNRPTAQPSGVVRMVVDTNGNVGIGDASPAAMLTVGVNDLFQVNSSGDLAKIKNITYSWPSAQGAASTVLTNNGSGGLSWAPATGGADLWTENAGEIYRSSNVGIGVTNPARALDVLGDINVDDTSSYQQGGITILNTKNSGSTVLVGRGAGQSTSASNNVAIGLNALRDSTTGSNNVAVGSQSLMVGNGSLNSAFGVGALQNSTANHNVAIGAFAGDNLTTGERNIIIGATIDAPVATGNNQLTIGNLIYGTGVDGAGTTVSSGNIGIGDSSPSAKLTVGNGDLFRADDSYISIKRSNNTFQNQILFQNSGGSYPSRIYTDGVQDSGIRFATGPADGNPAALLDRLVITNAGNIEIPSQTITHTTDNDFYINSYDDIQLRINSDGVGIGNFRLNNGSNQNIFAVSNDGDVSITGQPGSPTGGISLTQDASTWNIWNIGSGFPGLTGSLVINSGGSTDAMVIAPNANVGIGVFSLSGDVTEKLTVKGNASVSGNVYASSIRLNATTAKPACVVGIRGTTWFTQGGAGVKDAMEVCAKDAGGAYAWRVIY